MKQTLLNAEFCEYPILDPSQGLPCGIQLCLLSIEIDLANEKQILKQPASYSSLRKRPPWCGLGLLWAAGENLLQGDSEGLQAMPAMGLEPLLPPSS